jgi:thiol:disulfide interchange protein DsbD
MKSILFSFILLLTTLGSFAQIEEPVHWQFSSKMTGSAEAELTFTATIDKGWHIYALKIDGSGPIPTSINITSSDDYTLVGGIEEKTKPVTSFDKTFGITIGYYESKAVFVQKVKLNKPAVSVDGAVEFMVCNDSQCLPPTEEPFSFKLKQSVEAAPVVAKNIDTPKVIKPKVETVTSSKTITSEIKTDSTTTTKPVVESEKKDVAKTSTSNGHETLWGIFIAGFLGGLAAFLMPCIFPMLPFTVSYFTKTASGKGSAVGKALFYGFSIIAIYVSLGLAVTLIFGSDALNELASNGVFNFLFFLLLIVFAASFLGAFEITLPSSWINKSEAYADKGGFVGIFFMATSLALVSFSCTGPIIGTLLVEAATKGALLGPAIGMLGFAIALALPFALFAMFPSWLNQMPKSGGWLNSVKVVLGFLELALALKFLSNVDLAYHWNLLDREVFLVLWIVVFGLMGLYLLGKIKFLHDAEFKGLTVTRLMLAIVTLSFTMYMIPGLWGAPLKAISAFLPPQHTQDFDLYTPTLTGGAKSSGEARKYMDRFHAPYNLDAFFDYDEALAYAKKVNKPVMIDFTGHTCVNCRKMEADVWSDKTVLNLLQNNFVLVQLYVDDKTELPQSEQYASTFSGKSIKAIGNKWSDFQASRFQANSQPFYVLLNTNGELLVEPSGANYNAAAFADFLKRGLDRFALQ